MEKEARWSFLGGWLPRVVGKSTEGGLQEDGNARSTQTTTTVPLHPGVCINDIIFLWFTGATVPSFNNHPRGFKSLPFWPVFLSSSLPPPFFFFLFLNSQGWKTVDEFKCSFSRWKICFASLTAEINYIHVLRFHPPHHHAPKQPSRSCARDSVRIRRLEDEILETQRSLFKSEITPYHWDISCHFYPSRFVVLHSRSASCFSRRNEQISWKTYRLWLVTLKLHTLLRRPMITKFHFYPLQYHDKNVHLCKLEQY